jgi:lupus La protein
MMEMTGGGLNLPVSMDNLLKFGRMKRFKSASAIVAALRESNFLDVTGAEGQESVSRKVAFDPNARPRTESKSVYVKGFGDEEPSSQFDIEAFFGDFPDKAKCHNL